VATRIRDRDRGARALMKRVINAKARVIVGIHEAEGAADHDGATVAEIGSYHEFGLGVPRRSFIADWSDESEADNRATLKKIGQAVVKGTLPSVENGLERFGLKAVSDVQARIKAGIAPDLAEETIRLKGSSTPLIDKGTLWQSIRHEVTKE
jgi:hypothetical protein